MSSAHVIISGFVIGIGFRAFIKSKAKDLDLEGWVANTNDGKVEALFVGDKDKIEQAIKECWKGPFLADVTDVKVQWKEKDSDDIIGFNIIK